jgi:hypothetical protein
MRYEGTLPASVYGNRRNTLIESYRQTVGKHYNPLNIHPALK